VEIARKQTASDIRDSNSESPFDLDSVPRIVNLSPRESQLQVKVFQCSAFPAKIVEAIHNLDIPRKTVRAATQWRLDFPRPQKLIDDNSKKAVISIAESLLTRGATPYCLPGCESLVDLSSSELDFNRLEDALTTVASSPTCRFDAIRFDSEEEREFLRGEVRTWQDQNSLTTQEAMSSLKKEVQNLQQQSAAQFKTLTDYERRGLFAKLFGGGPR
jgi:hypothetical protein